ncbi:MAG: flagella basal body P-ring formation protein FlgA [Cyanobacteria bacterium TGS_CYA1]|nr:flagella basal body P-ring formation protein FlgA [Cyanobacteria bacterium TGS_CYA1]
MKSLHMDKKSNLLSVLMLVLPALVLAAILTWIAAFVIDSYQSTEAWRQKGIHKIGQVVVTEKPIAEGATFKEEDLFEIMVDPDSLNANAILCKDFVVGKIAHYSLEADRHLTCEDIGIKTEELESLELKKFDNMKPHPFLGICSHDISSKIPMAKSSNVVKTTREIEEGAVIKLEDLKLEPADTGYDTTDAIRDIRSVVGHQIRYSTLKNQTLVRFDFKLDASEPVRAVVALRDLKPQEQIQDKDIELRDFSSDEYPMHALLDKRFAAGNKALRKIKRDQVIRSVDVSNR